MTNKKTVSVEISKTQKKKFMVNVAERTFYIWKLEYWWIAFDKPEFYPEGRKHLKGGWFWRK